MAVIYAEIDRIKRFQEFWGGISSKLENAVSGQDTRISEVRNALNKALIDAEEICDNAKKALDRARDDLDRTTQSEHDVDEQLSRKAECCERAYNWAQRQVDDLEERRGRFEECCVKYTSKQDQVLSAAKKLEKKGDDWLTQYVCRLQEAKRAIFQDSSAGNGSFLATDGGYIGARELTETERAQLCQKTGWTEKTLNKCQIRPDGSVWLKANNANQDEERYNGILFERDTVVIGGVRVEGVFPKFDSIFTPDVRMPEELWLGKGENYNAHFAWCRAQLKAAVESNHELSAQFTPEERKLILAEKELDNYTWHHHQQPGKMQLIRSDRHNPRKHGVSHTGGNALWCTKFPVE